MKLHRNVDILQRRRVSEMIAGRPCFSLFTAPSYTQSSFTGNPRKRRLKSPPPVLEEFDVPQSLNVEYIFIEYDSLLAKWHMDAGRDPVSLYIATPFPAPGSFISQ